MFRYLETRIIGTAVPGPGTPPATLWQFYWHYISQSKFWYGINVVTVFCVALLELSVPVTMGQLTNLLQVDDPRATLQENAWFYLGLLSVLLIFRPVIQMADVALRFNVLLPGGTCLIRWQSHWQVVRQNWSFFQNDFAGRIANRVVQTGGSLRESVLSTTRSVIYISVFGFSAVFLMLSSDWRLALPTVFWLLSYAVFLKFFIPRLLELARMSSLERSTVMARVVDSYTNILTVKLFARAEDEDAYVRDSMDAHQRAMAAHMRLMSLYLGTLHLLNGVLIGSTVLLGVILWLNGTAAAVVVATAIPLAWQIANLSGWISFDIANIFENIGVVQEGMQSIAVKHQLTDKPSAKPLQLTQGKIEFANVNFNYGNEIKVIQDLSLCIQPGERVGLVGSSGAGKSTLIHLLLRFFEIQSGAIRVDDQDIRDVTQESLRGAIGFVTQDTTLLHRSIADNIRYGKPQASDEEVEAAAKQAQAHDFIVALEDWQGRKGYQARTGERGVKLSGGQRQRIAIARVILKNAPILILDEATSALDSEVESVIQEQLMGLMDGKTVIAIAHRLSTIARMDRLVIMDQGRIVEQGTHAQLLSLGGIYSKLWQHQSGGFLPERFDEPGNVEYSS